jgi:hypothetical protein
MRWRERRNAPAGLLSLCFDLAVAPTADDLATEGGCIVMSADMVELEILTCAAAFAPVSGALQCGLADL